MKAVNRAKIYERPRTRLETVIPLDTPFSIGVDISNLCNMSCNFCFHSDKNAIQSSGIKFGFMDFELYKKLIDDMCEFPNQVKKLKFGGFGEPLLNKELPNMIKYAKDKNAAERIELYTNGILLSEKLNKELITSGLDWINISLNGINSEEYKQKCNCNINMDKLIYNINDFYENRNQCKVYLKLGDTGYSEDEKEEFYKIFGNSCDEIYIENIVENIWNDVNLNISKTKCSVYNTPLKHKYVCPFVFIYMIINHDGTVISCCSNWKKDNIIGDLKKESAVQIWQGKTLYDMQVIQLNKNRHSLDMCKNCDSPMLTITDDIDDYSDDILMVLKEKRNE